MSGWSVPSSGTGFGGDGQGASLPPGLVDDVAALKVSDAATQLLLDHHDTEIAAVKAVADLVTTTTVVVTAAAGEQGFRDALAIGLAKVTAPGTLVIVDVPAQPDIQLAAPLAFDSLEAPRLFLRAPAWDLIPAPTAIVSVVAAGVNNVWGVPLYDVTLQTAAVHGLLVGDNCVLVARSVTGTPTGVYQPLAGYHRVTSIPAANQVRFRIPSNVSLAGLATALAGANSITFTLHRVKVHMKSPANASVLYFLNTRVLGFANFGLECAGTGENAVPLYVTGVATQIASSGSLAIRGGAVGLNLLNGSVMRWGNASQEVIPSTDWIVAFTGGSAGMTVNVGTYLDASTATSVSSCGHALFGVFIQSGEGDFPRLGMYGGNGTAALQGIKRARAFFRIVTIPMGASNNVGVSGSQISADSLSYIDAQGLNTGIVITPAANTVGNNGSYITR